MMKEKLNPNCGIRLRECREAAGLTQKQLADAIHTTYQSISNIERGERRLTADNAIAAANVFGIRMEYLLCEDDFKDYDEYNNSIAKDIFEKDHKIIFLETVLGNIYDFDKGYFFKRKDNEMEHAYYFSDDDVNNLYKSINFLIDGWVHQIIKNQSQYGIDENKLLEESKKTVIFKIKNLRGLFDRFIDNQK